MSDLEPRLNRALYSAHRNTLKIAQTKDTMLKSFTYSVKYPNSGKISTITIHAQNEEEAQAKWIEYKKRLGISQEI